MPELPEVETVCRSLRQVLLGHSIEAVSVTMPKLLKLPQADTDYFSARLGGTSVVEIDRRGKYILLILDSGQVLTIHLRMTGQLLYLAHQVPVTKHTHIILQLDNGYDLRYHDVRQFGAWYLTDQADLEQVKGLHALGLEPLAASFTVDAFQDLLAGKKQKAKVFLLDQRFVAGIGNIYADEILFQAHIHPNTTMEMLNDDEIALLWWAIRDRLSQGIAYGGSSIKDYVDGLGQAGQFQNYHKVYGRSGQPCVECGTTIEKIKVAGRSTAYCPNCQPRGTAR